MNIEELKAKALAATACNLDTAQIVRNNPDDEFDCPVCNGEGYVSGVVDYCNIDSLAVGVMFYGIGKEHGADEEYFRAANPAAILELIAELEAVKAELSMCKNKLELAEEEIEVLHLNLDGLGLPRKISDQLSMWGRVTYLRDDLDALRARIEAAEKQEPVGMFLARLIESRACMEHSKEVPCEQTQQPNWKTEAKRAFWAGLEIGSAFGACAILPKWEEYITKRESEISDG